MKKFDLEAAKAGAEVVNQSGKPVRIICFDAIGTTRPIVALISFTEDGITEEFIETYTPSGDANDGISLHMAPVKRQAWANIYLRDKTVFSSCSYDTELKAIGGRSDIERQYFVDTVLLHEWTD